MSALPTQPAAIFLSHGGGPLPVLGDPGHEEMVQHLGEIAAVIRKPKAIVVVSAHWEAATVTITSNPQPSIIYDYYGFPAESYALQYPAPGDSALATRLGAAFSAQGITADLDAARGFDHGLFIPLLLMYPDADIPCVQVSLLSSLDPAQHIRMGAALAGLAADNILVLGSGFSFHNLKVLMRAGGNSTDAENEAFESWLAETCTSTGLNDAERSARLVDWAQAPGARYCHPREEHLLPLHVCHGVTQSVAQAHTSLQVMGKRCSTFFW